MEREDEEGEQKAHQVYFDGLSQDILENILRLFSESPRAEKWENHLTLTEIVNLHEAGGALEQFIPTLCAALRLDDKDIYHYRPPQDERTRTIGCQPQSLAYLSRRLPKKVTEALRVLTIHNDRVDRDVAKPIRIIHSKCNNIHELVLGFGLLEPGEWVKKLGSGLETLRCISYFCNIGKYCPNLLHLYLYYLPNYYCETEAWRQFCKKLETLSVFYPTDAIQVVKYVEKYCRKIKQLELSGQNEDVREAISKCIASYGTQLMCFRAYMFSSAQLLRVKKACPNTSVELVANGDMVERSAKIVGKELKEISVRALQTYQGGENSDVFKDCINIEKAKFCSLVYTPVIQCVFKQPKYHLRSLEISFEGLELEKFEKVVGVIAKGSGGLEEFMFICKEIKKGLFTDLIARNKSIKNIAVILQNSLAKNDVAFELVKSFLEALKIKKIKIDLRGTNNGEGPIGDIAEICQKQELRRVCVSVFDIDYLK